ncbi:hypothetical protein ACO0M4_05835 [Streptomyces sp. RGM 3693]|uniref:hypothetical protein n=1 Tax=Streptomyces sp. RGM 3693 TaxID=3413284 RepID=UPI003D27E2A9
MSHKAVAQLSYHESQAHVRVRVRPILGVINTVTSTGQVRLLAGLQTLATGETAYTEGNIVRR